MSYLESPRIVFSGRFQADVSTVNNDVRHYNNSTWNDDFQKMGGPRQAGGRRFYNGWWNPDGTGSFRLIDVAVTGAQSDTGPIAGDPVLALKIESNVDCPPAKLVDLDPQFQMGSMIWGMQIVLTDGVTEYLRGDFEPAPFRDLFFTRVAGQNGSGFASAKFTSLLKNIRWNEAAPASALLAALKQSADANDGCLSANFMTFAYDTGATHTNYTLGRIIGAIGPWRSDEPRSFTAGRRFAPAANANPFGTAQDNIGYFDAVIDGDRVHVDLGNALPLDDVTGVMTDLGTLSLVVLNAPDVVSGTGPAITLTPGCAEGAAVTAADYAPIGDIDYQTAGWLAETAGIVSLPLGAEAATLAGTSPLALVITNPATGAQCVAIRETIGSYFVRADDFEQRVDAVSGGPVQIAVTLRCTRFGKPLAGDAGGAVQLQLAPADATEGANGGPPTGVDPKELDPLPDFVPTINVPATALHFSSPVAADAGGVATATIQVDDPANSRGYIEGQIFTLPYAFGFTGESAMPLFEQILLHVRDAYAPPASPVWETDVEPVLKQFGNLYPIMSHGLFSFSDLEIVARNAGILIFALSKPIEDPNHMPATRDMSAGKRQMLLNWLRPKAGAPRLEPPAMPAMAADAAVAALPEAQIGLPMPASYSRFSRMKGLPSEDFEGDEEAQAQPEPDGAGEPAGPDQQ